MEYVLHQRRNWRGVQLNHRETRRRQDEESLRDTQVERRDNDIYSSYTSCLYVCVFVYTHIEPINVLDIIHSIRSYV